jgi:hypothetical protein
VSLVNFVGFVMSPTEGPNPGWECPIARAGNPREFQSIVRMETPHLSQSARSSPGSRSFLNASVNMVAHPQKWQNNVQTFFRTTSSSSHTASAIAPNDRTGK